MKYKKMPTGYGIVQTEVMRLKTISIQAKAVYSYFASMTGSKDFCFPRQDTISADLGISISSVKRYINELVENGLVRKGKLYKDMRKNNKYEVMFLDYEETTEDSTNRPPESYSIDTERAIINNNINNNNINNIEANASPQKQEKKIEDKNYGYKRTMYFDFLYGEGFKKKSIDSAIFGSGKERKQLDLLLKKFEKNDDVKKFLAWCKKDNWIVKNCYMPSIIVGQYAKWQAQQGKKNNGVGFEFTPVRNDYDNHCDTGIIRIGNYEEEEL